MSNFYRVLKGQYLNFFASWHLGEVIRQKNIYPILNRLVKEAQDILDAGAGRGDFLFHLIKINPKVRLFGIDADSKLVDLIKKRAAKKGHQFNLKTDDLVNLKDKEKYDLIYSVDVLEHLTNPQKVIHLFFKALKPKGTLIIHTPAQEKMRFFKRFAAYKVEDHLKEGFRPEELSLFFEQAGFKEVKMNYTFGKLGALAWELYKLTFEKNRILGIFIYPFLYFLGTLDARRFHAKGNGILVIAKK